MGGSRSPAATARCGCADARKVGVSPGRDWRCAEDGCLPWARMMSSPGENDAEDRSSPGETVSDLMCDLTDIII